ncbi:MAG: excinuclease ABC subunit UvrB [Proteobacteria bacterium]|nr:excinuclease ABC subunit UvrB [Pseudomonadota bacterium]
MSYLLHSPWSPCGDQPKAIQSITSSFQAGKKEQTLLGVTGSGKTFTMAHVISQLNQPALIIAPNKTLAAQLFTEFLEFFPNDAVNYFISYYDYYQPEAYIPSSDTYIAKDASVNDDIDKMRHRATQDLFEKPQVIIVASVSCIYGLGSPDSYSQLALQIKQGSIQSRRNFLSQLLRLQYQRNDVFLKRGCFRVRGETCDIMPAHQKNQAIRVEFFGDEISDIFLIDTTTGDEIKALGEVTLFPNSHYIVSQRNLGDVIAQIRDDLRKQLQFFQSVGKVLEGKRLEERVQQDIESFEQLGYCPGIENYSRYLSGTAPGEPPPTLLSYFPDSFVTIIDESHLTIPQISGMFRGDRSRKQNLVDFGFRLPAALDNRPLSLPEFHERVDKVLYVSATPGQYEIERSQGGVVQQIIRPTGLIDPKIVIKPAKTQIDELQSELTQLINQGGKAFVLTLTKRMSEDLTDYFSDVGFRVKYLHSRIKTLERSDILRGLRQDEFDILIGINLLREGLDLPEISLVAILDADKEGFLRSKNSLIQMIGRAARHLEGRVIFFADSVTKSMKLAMEETERRRKIQILYNKTHNIEPKSTSKKLSQGLRAIYGITPGQQNKKKGPSSAKRDSIADGSIQEINALMARKRGQMIQAAGELNFEAAHQLKQEIATLASRLSELSDG